MSHRAARIITLVANVLRRLALTTLTGFAVLGAGFYGGSGVYAVWTEAAQKRSEQRQAERTQRRAERDQAKALNREAAEGIVEIEAFLDAQVPGPDRTDVPPVRGRHRNRQPGGDAA